MSKEVPSFLDLNLQLLRFFLPEVLRNELAVFISVDQIVVDMTLDPSATYAAFGGQSAEFYLNPLFLITVVPPTIRQDVLNRNDLVGR